MEYQDQKIRAIGRLTAIATGLTILLALCLTYRGQFETIFESVPLHWLRDKYIWLGGLVTMVSVCWLVNFTLIFTSPEQEVRLVAWSKRWLKITSDFERINFDKLDPDYRKVAWRYFLDRRSG